MPIRLHVDGAFAIITIDRCEALNALNFELIEEISSSIDQVSRSDARVLLFVGAGEIAFCAGADIKQLMHRNMQSHRAGIELGQTTFAKLDRLRIPSIAVIQGYAFGGGMELAMACTFRVATPNAKMGLPEIKLGLIPGYGGTQRLPRLIGEARAMELIMSGRTIDAVEAERIGLVNLIADGPDPVSIGREFGSRFEHHSQCALFFARQAVQRSMSATLNEGLLVEADLIALAFQTEDSREGMQAFTEKRKPAFKDR